MTLLLLSAFTCLLDLAMAHVAAKRGNIVWMWVFMILAGLMALQVATQSFALTAGV